LRPVCVKYPLAVAAALTEFLLVKAKIDIATRARAINVIPINIFFDFFICYISPKVWFHPRQNDLHSLPMNWIKSHFAVISVSAGFA
jgi:hypothetical protein